MPRWRFSILYGGNKLVWINANPSQSFPLMPMAPHAQDPLVSLLMNTPYFKVT
jgi:hypothetical protein